MYIRTKDDNIYDLGSKGVSSWEYIDNDTAINKYGVKGAFYTIYYFDENKGHYSEYDNKGGRSCDFIDEKDILKQSENLEELCDEIVYDYRLYQNKTTWDDRLVEDSFEELDEPITDEMIKEGIYGAIWTSRGLIYVAKMNENGELELIWERNLSKF